MAEIVEPKGTSVLFKKETKQEKVSSELLKPKVNGYIKAKYAFEYLVAGVIFCMLSDRKSVV